MEGSGLTLLQASVTLAVICGLGLFYYLMDMTRQSPRRVQIQGKAFTMPDMRFHYTPAALYAALDAMGAENRPRMKRYWLLDFGFILCLLGVMLSIDLNVDGPATTLYLVMGGIAIARAVLDALENILLLRLYRAYPVKRNRLAAFAGYVTSLKFLCLYAWVALLFIKLFTRAFGITG